MSERSILLLMLLLLTFIAGVATGYVSHHKPAPVCIVVHANSAPAPASCSNPNSYQVNG